MLGRSWCGTGSFRGKELDDLHLTYFPIRGTIWASSAHTTFTRIRSRTHRVPGFMDVGALSVSELRALILQAGLSTEGWYAMR